MVSNDTLERLGALLRSPGGADAARSVLEALVQAERARARDLAYRAGIDSGPGEVRDALVALALRIDAGEVAERQSL